MPHTALYHKSVWCLLICGLASICYKYNNHKSVTDNRKLRNADESDLFLKRNLLPSRTVNNTPKPMKTSRLSFTENKSKISHLVEKLVDVESEISSVLETLEKSLEVTHPSYEIIARDVVSEYGAYTALYRHRQSGAELLSVSSDDDNKVFGITFRTPPEDSTGVPHILEHSTLCGSRNYKTKDPFASLLRGSLQTFLNAMTFPDRTCYVCASQNLGDFYNLVNVYSDAVYFPLAVSDPNILAQEGWRLELENASQNLTYKGVVYNEMKGVYSSPDSLLGRESRWSLFPDNTYHFDSGGDSKVIPQLSFEQLKNFHAKFYHPANSRIYFSGDDDIFERLEIMDKYLNEFQDSPESEVESTIKWQLKIFNETKRSRIPYSVGDSHDANHMVNVNWLLNDRPLTGMEDLTLKILEHLLLGTSSSYLYKIMIESGLGTSLTSSGLSTSLLQTSFYVGMKGVHPDNIGKVETLIVDTLQKVLEEGFSDDAIAASMNTVEFSMREFNTGLSPKGLELMLLSMSKWIYDYSPTEGLKFEKPLNELKKKIARSGSLVFQDAIREFFLDNTHRSTVEMFPSKTLEEEQVKEEQDRLASIKSSLNPTDLQKIITDTAQLKKIQATEDTQEEKDTIPSIKLDDIDRDVIEYPINVAENESNSGVTVVRHELASSSGIIYVDFGVDLSQIPFKDALLLPLFTKMMMENGAGEYDDVALSRRIGTYTGGISISLMNIQVQAEGKNESQISTGDNMITKLFIRGKATADKTDEVLSIFKVILSETRLDSPAKVKEILKKSVSRMESSIQKSGNSYAYKRMHARYNPASYITERMSGISYLDTLRGLLKQAENDWTLLLTQLESIRNVILNQGRSGMILNLTGEKKVMEQIQPNVDSFLNTLPGSATSSRKLPHFYSETHPWIVTAREEMEVFAPIKDEGFLVPTQVSYVGKGGLLYSLGESVQGSSAVIAHFLHTGYLWDHVRLIGGAYGVTCSFSTTDGFFAFLSYRDPNLEKTLDVYDGASDDLLKSADLLAHNQAELTTAIIGTIGNIDGPLSSDQKGWVSLIRWLKNESPEFRQKYRDEILNTKSEDFRNFAFRLKDIKSPSVAVVGSKGALGKAKESGTEMDVNDIFKGIA